MQNDDQKQTTEDTSSEASAKDETPAEEAKQEEPKAEEAPKEETKAEDATALKGESRSEERKPSVDLSASAQKIVEQVEKLSVLELSQLVKALEEKFGVSAAPTVVAGAAPAAGTGEAADEQTTFNVVLAESGANKISVIKAVRELVPTLGLKEAKDLVDAPPKNILEGVNKEAASEAKTKLEAAGAKVELK